MADRIEIDFTANVREVMKGTDEIGDGLKKTERALDDVGAQGEQSLDKVTDAQGEVADATGKTGDALKDLGGVAKDALEGDLGGAAEGAVQSLSGLAAMVPGVGGAVGAAIGVVATEGVGFLVSSLEEAQRVADETKTRISSAYQSAAEEGRAFLDQAQIQKATTDIIFGDDGLYEQAQKDAARLGLSTLEVVGALAGDQEKLNVVLTRSNELSAQYNQKLEDSIGTTSTRGILASHEGEALADINSRYTTQKQLADQNTAKAEEYLQSTKLSAEQIERRNEALANAPKEILTKLLVDDSDLEIKLQSRTLRVFLEGVVTRDGRPIP